MAPSPRPSSPSQSFSKAHSATGRRQPVHTRSVARILVAVMLLVAVALDASARRHAFVVPGYDYKGDGTVTVLEPGDLAFRKVNVTDGFELYFNPNSTSGLFSVETASRGYGCLGKLVELLFTPYRHVRITRIRIYVFDDRSNGIKHGTSFLTFTSGDPGHYTWTGSSTKEVSLKVSSSERNAMKFKCIEVDYESSVNPGGDQGGGDEGDDNGGGDGDGDDDDDDGKGDQGGQDGDDTAELKVIFSPENDAPITPDVRIALSCNVSTATIYYRTDGQTPSCTKDEIYRSPFKLSLPDRMTVSVIAVTQTGRFTTAQRTYRFASVSTISDFMANGSYTQSVTMSGRFTVAYGKDMTLYVSDSNGDYVPVTLGRHKEYAPGTVLGSITALKSRDKDGYDVISATSDPVVASYGGYAPQPERCEVADILYKPLHSYVSLSGVTLRDGVAFGDDGRAVWISDRYGCVPASAQYAVCDIAGFVGLYGGVKCVYPVSVKTNDDDKPDDPEEKTDSCTLAYAAAGGTIEIFAEINDYTLTPVGRPLGMPCKIVKGKAAYAYLHPAKDREFTSAFLDAEVILPGSPLVRLTPYGVMIEVDMSTDRQLLVTFGEVNGIEGVDQDDAEAEYYTIGGVRLGSDRPTKAGVYIVRRGNKTQKIVIN